MPVLPLAVFRKCANASPKGLSGNESIRLRPVQTYHVPGGVLYTLGSAMCFAPTYPKP